MKITIKKNANKFNEFNFSSKFELISFNFETVFSSAISSDCSTFELSAFFGMCFFLLYSFILEQISIIFKRIDGKYFFVLNWSDATNHANETNVNKRFNIKNKLINGKYDDWTGISLETRIDIIPNDKNVFIAKKKFLILI